MKRFNTAAVCLPSEHYMADLSERVREIKKMVDDEKYFTITRPGQYGKTTILCALKNVLEKTYEVAGISFGTLSAADFDTEQSFIEAFCRLIKRENGKGLSIPSVILKRLEGYLVRKADEATLSELYDTLSEWCELSAKPVVLIVDDVDTEPDNQVFRDFLAQLRCGYISRDMNDEPFFHSVILAGVTDVKSPRNEIHAGKVYIERSPWNIAADFTLDMSLSETDIKGMLDEYEADHHTGMNTEAAANSIRGYTNGYPFLVSRICQLIDEKLVPSVFAARKEAWTEAGVEEAVKLILAEKNPLFDFLIKKICKCDKLKEMLHVILLQGDAAYLMGNEEQKQLIEYGFIVPANSRVTVANRIIEMCLNKYFAGESRRTEEPGGDALDHLPEIVKKR